MKSDNTKIIIGVIIAVFLSSFFNALASGTLFDSNEVVYDDYNTNINQSTVQGAIDTLYAAATDYSGVNTRLSTLENYFDGDVTSTLRNNGLRLGYGTSTNTTNGHYGWVDWFYDGENKGGIAAHSTGLVINAKNQDLTYGSGDLELNGSPIKMNGINVTDVTTGSCTIDTTYTGKSTWGAVTYAKLGKLVILNIYEIYPKGYTTAGSYKICGGLPVSSGSYFAILAQASGNGIYRVNSENGNLYWFYTNAGTNPASGQLIYFTN